MHFVGETNCNAAIAPITKLEQVEYRKGIAEWYIYQARYGAQTLLNGLHSLPKDDNV